MSDPLNEFESRASVAMHDLVPATPDTSSLFDQVASRVAARRRLRTRLAAAGACLAVVATIATVSWGTHDSASVPGSSVAATTQATTAQVAAPTCASSIPDVDAWTADNAPAAQLVPGSPAVATACRYYGFDVPHPQGALAASVVVRADVATWAKVFNSGKPVPSGDVSCASDTGNRYLIEFAYENAPSLRVEVQGSGCLWASNGSVTRYAAGLPLLEQALGKDVQSPPGALVIPTWDSGRGGPTALINGSLSGQVKNRRLCALISVPGQSPVPVVWPAGSTAKQVGKGWKVLSAAGKTLGRAGQHLSFGGGWVPVVLVAGTLHDAGCPSTDEVVLYTP